MLLAAAMFINNNSPSLNRQLLIRWAAKEINYESSFFVWSKMIIITILLSLSSLKLAGEVRRSDSLTYWLYLNILLSNTLLFLSGVTRPLTRPENERFIKSQTDSDQTVQHSSQLPDLLIFEKPILSICATGLALPYLNIKTQMSLYQRSKFLTKQGKHLSLPAAQSQPRQASAS